MGYLPSEISSHFTGVYHTWSGKKYLSALGMAAYTHILSHKKGVLRKS